MKDIRTCSECGQEYEQAPEFKTLTECICDTCDEARAQKTRDAIRAENSAIRFANVVGSDYRDTDRNHPDYVAQAIPRKLAGLWKQGKPPQNEERKMFLAFIGESGKCKSRIAAMIVKELIEDGHGVKWINSAEFQYAAQNQHYSDQSSEAKRVLAATRNTPWLILDDLGNLDTTRPIVKALYAVLEHRISNKMPMIWTSNETIDEILSGEGITEKDRNRVISRLLGNTNIIQI